MLQQYGYIDGSSGFFGDGWGGYLVYLLFSFFFLIPNPGDRKMTVTTDKLVRCLVGDVL